MKVAIIGGGIGGLSAAIALKQHGHEVSVYERAQSFQDIGAGLQISPNGMKVLKALDVDISMHAFAPQSLEMRDIESAKRVFSLPLEPLVRKWGAPYFHIHRSHLHNALLKKTDGISIHMDSEISDADADVVIGADGVNSGVAKQHFGLAPRYSGFAAWRAAVPVRTLKNPPPPTACVWSGAGRHIVTTRIDGGHTVNMVGISPHEWDASQWAAETTDAEFFSKFGSVHPVLHELATNAQKITKWALLERETYFGDDRYVLLGDAAHPVLPSMAQGAVMALEDAYVLGEVLGKDLKQYTQLRQGRVEKIVRRSRKNVNWFHRKGATQKLERMVFSSVSRVLPWPIHYTLSKTYAYDVTKQCG